MSATNRRTTYHVQVVVSRLDLERDESGEWCIVNEQIGWTETISAHKREGMANAYADEIARVAKEAQR